MQVTAQAIAETAGLGDPVNHQNCHSKKLHHGEWLPSVWEGVSTVLRSLGERHLLRLVMLSRSFAEVFAVLLFPGSGSVLLLHSLPQHLLIGRQRATARAQR